ncbi:hypothetical protein R2Q81_06870 [Microbacterium aquimaris]|nr:hypothetical protein [Microbacterium aquimaris]MDZ8275673.1 hypothetical protein [Microbacterium aquimaris]
MSEILNDAMAKLANPETLTVAELFHIAEALDVSPSELFVRITTN